MGRVKHCYKELHVQQFVRALDIGETKPQNNGMDRIYMHKVATVCAERVWEVARFEFGACIGACPVIVINNRLKTSAGYAHLNIEPQTVNLSAELMYLHPIEMQKTIIPHELAHVVAFRLYGDTGHGNMWKHVMVKLGQEPNRCHNLKNSIHEARKRK